MDNPVDPELLQAVELYFEIYKDSELNLETLAAARALGENQVQERIARLPKIEEVTQEDQLVARPAGNPNVRVRIYKPKDQTGSLPGLLWIHGGGYTMGGIDGDDYPNKLRVRNVGCVIVSVDYRLAPENPYPAAIEDCYTVLKWMADHSEVLGVDRSRIGIGGQSAGGGLAASLALMVRDRGELNIVFQMLIYPMIDDCNIAPADEKCPDTVIWSRSMNLFGWTSYLGRPPGGDDVSPYEAAFRAKDLTDLPPSVIVVGDLDLFVEENIEYARRLILAGISTELHVYPGAFHGFNGLVPGAKVSRDCNTACNDALKKALYRR